MWNTFILVLPYLLLIISELLYGRRVEKKPTGLRRYLVIQWLFMLLVVVILTVSIGVFGLTSVEKEYIPTYAVVCVVKTLFTLWNLAFVSREEKCAALIQVVRESPAVIDKGRDMVEVKRIRTKDIPLLQEHLTVIMQTIKKEDLELTPNSLEISVVKIRRKYCVMIDYFHLKQELSEFAKRKTAGKKMYPGTFRSI